MASRIFHSSSWDGPAMSHIEQIRSSEQPVETEWSSYTYTRQREGSCKIRSEMLQVRLWTHSVVLRVTGPSSMTSMTNVSTEFTASTFRLKVSLLQFLTHQMQATT
jgi:hypothetical protein